MLGYLFHSTGFKTIPKCYKFYFIFSLEFFHWIVSSTGNKNVVCRHLELSDMDSVRKFAKETIEKEKKIDVLVNNAGMASGKRKLSKQGHELTLATNHYGPFLLTILLLGLDLGDMHFKNRSYSWIASYGQTKLCNVLFTNELARLLAEKGINKKRDSEQFTPRGCKN
ncbi:hypothetical protein Anas_12704 [Armadillidium nasatum]|uniref:Retinol dehydrogenase 13 n=1 Tax=Armadillidium nasatum TaxID=96803 RepID=A0A5N5SW29_9CRUS|nr:hypothetical protein Anas_12704 [Armadillidium nasatum]